MSRYSMCSGMMSKQKIFSGQPVVLFLLVPSDMNRYYTQKGQASLTSNEGSKVLYEPISLPIKGVYDESEILTNIEMDDNIKSLEKRLGGTILEILNRVGDERETLGDEVVNNLMNFISIGMEHRSIYDKIVAHDKECRSYLISDVYFTVLEKLGFEQTETVKDRYFRKYEHPNLKDIVVYSDNTFTSIKVNGKDKTAYNIKSFLELTGLSHDIMKDETNSSLFIDYAEKCSELYIHNEKTQEELDIEAELNTIDMQKVSQSPESDEMKRLGLLIEKLQEEKDKNNNFSKEDKKRNEHYFNVKNSVKDKLEILTEVDVFKQDRNALNDYFHFCYGMWSTSSLFMPTYSGYNDCEKGYSSFLYEAIKDIVRD